MLAFKGTESLPNVLSYAHHWLQLTGILGIGVIGAHAVKLVVMD